LLYPVPHDSARNVIIDYDYAPIAVSQYYYYDPAYLYWDGELIMASTCTSCSSPSTEQCSRCHTPLCATHVQLGQPFITARQLVTVTATTAVRAPGLLGDLLLKELDKVPYCVSCRDELAQKRTGEQLKFLLSLLLIVGLLFVIPTLWILFR
jgi:hypothetical protein